MAETGWYTGPFSTWPERHAFIIGASAAILSIWTGYSWPVLAVAAISLGIYAAPDQRLPKKLRQLQREPWYAVGAEGFVLLAYYIAIAF